MEDLAYADQLARSYKERAELSGKWTDYLKAHGLANYCISKQRTARSVQLAYDIEKSWYNNEHLTDEHPLDYKKYQRLIRKHKKLLTKYGEEAKSKIETLNPLIDELDENDIFSETNLHNANRFSDELFTVSESITKGFVSVSEQIIRSSVETLECIDLHAPCSFVVIGLGSSAKGGATPYSDLEYVFVVDDESHFDYFHKLAIDSYFRIGNLGESPLKCFNIDALCGEDAVILPDIGTNGYKIDGITEVAGNIPTGNGLENGNMLTFTVDGFKKFYKKSAESSVGKQAGDKADMLSSTVVIYSNNGDSLYRRIKEARNEYEERETTRTNQIRLKRLESFAKDISNYSFLPNFVTFQPPKNLDIKVKQDIFRYSTLLANNIKMLMHWDLSYPWQIYSELRQQKIVDDETLTYLHITLALSIYMRTSAYLSKGSQTQDISLSYSTERGESPSHQIRGSLFVILGCLLVPIKQSIQDYVTKTQFLAIDCITSEEHVTNMLENIHVSKNDILAKIEVCYFSGLYDLAKKELTKVMGTPIQTVHLSKLLECLSQTQTSLESVGKYMELCAYVLYYTSEFSAAFNYFDWLTNNQRKDVTLWKLLAAHCKKSTGDITVSNQLLDGLTFDSLFDSRHEDTAYMCHSIADVLNANSMYEAALRYHKRGLEIDSSLSDKRLSPHIMDAHSDIGKLYYKLGQYSLSLQHHKQALSIADAISWRDTTCGALDIITCYSNIGQMHLKLEEYDTALDHHKEALKMSKDIFGADTNHSIIATSYNNIGVVYRELGEYQKALEYHIKALDIHISLLRLELP